MVVALQLKYGVYSYGLRSCEVRLKIRSEVRPASGVYSSSTASVVKDGVYSWWTASWAEKYGVGGYGDVARLQLKYGLDEVRCLQLEILRLQLKYGLYSSQLAIVNRFLSPRKLDVTSVPPESGRMARI